MVNKLIKCKTCSAEIAKSAKVCPSCGAKNKRPIYTKWWAWAIALFVIIIASSGGNDPTPSSTPPQTQNQNQSTNQNQNQDSNKKEEEKIYSIGDTVQAGKLAVVINSVEEMEVIDSNNQFIDDVTTEGKFIVIEAKITNNDNDSRTLDSALFTLKDENGRKYEAYTDVNLMMIFEKKYLFLENVNPGMSRTGLFAFEVPKEMNAYSLTVSPGFLASGSSQTIKLK